MEVDLHGFGLWEALEEIMYKLLFIKLREFFYKKFEKYFIEFDFEEILHFIMIVITYPKTEERFLEICKKKFDSSEFRNKIITSSLKDFRKILIFFLELFNLNKELYDIFLDEEEKNFNLLNRIKFSEMLAKHPDIALEYFILNLERPRWFSLVYLNFDSENLQFLFQRQYKNKFLQYLRSRRAKFYEIDEFYILTILYDFKLTEIYLTLAHKFIYEYKDYFMEFITIRINYINKEIERDRIGDYIMFRTELSNFKNYLSDFDDLKKSVIEISKEHFVKAFKKWVTKEKIYKSPNFLIGTLETIGHISFDLTSEFIEKNITFFKKIYKGYNSYGKRTLKDTLDKFQKESSNNFD